MVSRLFDDLSAAGGRPDRVSGARQCFTHISPLVAPTLERPHGLELVRNLGFSRCRDHDCVQLFCSSPSPTSPWQTWPAATLEEPSTCSIR
jgi:hypothetical protein